MNYYFDALLIACCIYAFAAGGRPEKIGAAFLGIAVVLTFAMATAPPIRFRSIEVGILVVDVLLFIAYVLLALRADRFWPIWVSALIGVGVLGHLAKWFAGPAMDRWAYAFSIAIWSYPILALLAVGTLSHQRRVNRIRAHGPGPVLPVESS